MIDGNTPHHYRLSTNGNEIIQMPDDPTRTGFIFDGWYWDNNSWQQPFTANSLLEQPISASIKVWAKWTVINQDITYILDGGTNHPSNPATINIESLFITLEDPTRDGYTFLGWMPGGIIAYWDSSCDRVFTATWGKNSILTLVNPFEDTTETRTVVPGLYFGGLPFIPQPQPITFFRIGWFEGETEFLNLGQFEGETEFINSSGIWLGQRDVTLTARLEPIVTISGGTITGLTSFGRTVGNLDLNIPSIVNGVTITAIGDRAFENHGNLRSIIIPDSVTTIGERAFEGCGWLTSVVIGSGVTTIGDWAFSGCTRLTSIIIPDSVTTIGDWAFRACISLTSVVIGNSVTTIGERAFSGCTGLTSIIIPDSVTTIDGRAFEYCTGLTSVVIGSGVTTIGDWAFRDCTGLTSVVIGNGVTTIGSGAFWDCTGLTSIVIPDSVTSIGEFAFWGCTNLTYINFTGTQAQWNAIDVPFAAIPPGVTIRFEWTGEGE